MVSSSLENIYSYDGTGFPKEITKERNYLQIEHRIQAFIPQDSIIGLMLHKLEKETVIFSRASDIEQHDVYTWQAQGNHFVRSKLTKSAKEIKRLLNELLDELSLKDREEFSEALFTILGDGEDDFIVGDLKYNLLRIPEMIKEYRELDAEEKQILARVLRLFYRKRLEARFADF